jgi:hypothetical protein
MESLGNLYFVSLASAFLTPLVTLFVPLPVLLYGMARWRSHREGHNDPQLGLKVALGYFRLLSYQIVLAGIFLLTWALMSDLPEEQQDEIRRAALGLLVPAVVVFLAHNLAAGHTNGRDFPIVGRLVAGTSLFFTGLLGFAAVMGAGFLFFQKSPDAETMRALASAVIVYGLAWFMQGLLVGRKSRPMPTPTV